MENVDNSKPTYKKCSVCWQPTISLVNFVLRRDVNDVINDIPLETYAKRINDIPEWQDEMMHWHACCKMYPTIQRKISNKILYAKQILKGFVLY